MARLTISCIVRRFCLDCQGNSSQAVRECADEGCALWQHRLPPQGAAPQGAAPQLLPDKTPLDNSAPIAHLPPVDLAGGDLAGGEQGPAHAATESTDRGGRPDAKAREAARRVILRAVRRHCLICAACRTDVRTCNARECGLWSYRFGVNPETYRAVRQRFSRPKTLSLF